jgi:hypothetical protein
MNYMHLMIYAKILPSIRLYLYICTMTWNSIELYAFNDLCKNFTGMRYLSLRVLKKVEEGVVGRLAILIEHVNILRLDELTHIHPAGRGGVTLYSDLAKHTLSNVMPLNNLYRLRKSDKYNYKSLIYTNCTI